MKDYKLLTSMYKDQLQEFYKLQLQKREIRDKQRLILENIQKEQNDKYCLFHDDNSNLMGGKLRIEFSNDLELRFYIDDSVELHYKDYRGNEKIYASSRTHEPNMSFIMLKEDSLNEKEN